MTTMKHELKKEGDELVETRTGEGLTNSKGETVDGHFQQKFYYPEHTARAMISELTRQLREKELDTSAKKSQIKESKKKLRPVDKAFFLKYQSCIAHAQIDKLETALTNEAAQMKELQDQLSQLKWAWPALFE